MNEDEQLRDFFVKQGSSPDQAATMAAQLQKRAAQLAGKRGWSREAALKHLLSLVAQGHGGEAPPGFPPTIPGQ